MIITTFIKLSHIDLIEVTNMRKNLFVDYAREHPHVGLAAGLGAYWLLMPSSKHGEPGHHHDKYCVNGKKYGYLAFAAAVPLIGEKLLGRDWYHVPIDLAADVAVPDDTPHAEEITKRVAARMKEPENYARIKRVAGLSIFYDALDTFVKDGALLPKMHMDETTPNSFLGIPLGVLKGKNVDLIGLGLTLYGGAKLGGGLKAFLDKERLLSTALLVGAETIESNIPSLTLGTGHEIYMMAARFAEEEKEKFK